MLSRLGIRQKLGLLLVIPLLAVAAVLVPFTAERINDARAAGVTARTALTARQVGALIQALQEERLLALGYLATSTLDRSALLAQTQTALDHTAELRAASDSADLMRAARGPLDALGPIRAAVLARRITPSAAYDAYRAANSALLDGLHLIRPPGADAAGLSQLGALDALMRSNEEASSVGALLVAAAADRDFSRSLLSDAVTADQQNLRRFHDLVDAGEASLVDTVERGAAGQRLREMITEVSGPGSTSSLDQVSAALTAAVTYTGLRRIAQDRVARDIATAAQSRADAAAATAWSVGIGAAVLFATVVGLGVTVSTSISRPLRRLTRAARVVADLARAELVRVGDSDTPDPAPPRLAAVEVASSDEIGALAMALNRVQATAALLLERQTTSRRNVAVMFANIARRTQNLVGRQLMLIDELERNERSPELLQRLYRLDHVATRLRRSADSLLVVSGTIDQVMSGVPTALPDIVRSSLAEIEGYRAVELVEVCPVAVSSSLVTDLRLLLAELLENATNFSPPGSPVMIDARMEQGECHITIVDHGLGMSTARLEEENRRLVERERLELAPTNVLGLFVVGRLARRHGLGVRLDHSPGRGITAHVRIPARLLSAVDIAGLPAAPMRTRPAPHPAIAAIDAVEVDVSGESFAWFQPPRELIAIGSAAESGPRSRPWQPEDAFDAGRGAAGPPNGGAHSPTAAHSPITARPGPAPMEAPRGDPAGQQPSGGYPPPTLASRLPRRTVRPVDGTVEGSPRSMEEPGGTVRGGLTRRIPGTHMAPGVRDDAEAAPAPPSRRDPEAERAALNDVLSGFARGEDGSTQVERQS